MTQIHKSNKPDVDITLLVEGTYPYVTGGVSSWIHQILCAFPHYKFGIIFLGSRPCDYGEPRYALPDNLVHLESHFLFTYESPESDIKNPADQERILKDIIDIHDKFKTMADGNITTIIADLHRQLFSKEGLTHDQFIFSKAAWDYITQKYDKAAPNISFIEYFWSVRNMHFPLWQLIEIARTAPNTKLLHSASTGYAGLLGSLIQNLRQCPYVLTEHGIYTKERRIDLLQMEWSVFNGLDLQKKITTKRYLTAMWIRFFEALARLSYSGANPIISLFDDYQQRQIQDGAPPERTRVIANGIDIQRFKAPNRVPMNPDKPVLCFVGRILQIKDIKTFIRAVAIIVHNIPGAKAVIVGGLDDDPNYVGECRSLVSTLRLDNNLEFLGKQVTEKILPTVDLLFLSSISEGLPFVILEGFAAGVPAVSTDVGACRELIYGKTPEDRALGKAGEVVGIANPKELATAAIGILQNPAVWASASQAAINRVTRYYSLQAIMDDYATIYSEALK
jgi:glycosyltransferase involved in cell wall biosynthesis